MEEKRREIIPCFISSYVPRQCGIATFTNNLANAIMQKIMKSNFQVVAINNNVVYDYPPEVQYEIHQHKIEDYFTAAEFINLSTSNIISVQHEFGLYGGQQGRYIIRLLQNLQKPVITTLHTVLKNPNSKYYTSLIEVIDHTEKVVVMTKKAVEILKDIYKIPLEKIRMIPHGVPDYPFLETRPFKQKLGYEGKITILTFGLLSPNKGIEFMLQGLAPVVKENPRLFYIVLGITHPELKRTQGEKYRLKLMKLTQKLGLTENVKFIDKYTTFEELCQYLLAADIYVTPYLSKEQITSGTLAYAVGLGKAIISTPYWHAEELLADGRGILVGFGNVNELSEALAKLSTDEVLRQRLRKAAYEYGREMVWSKIADKYLKLFQEELKNERKVNRKVVPLKPTFFPVSRITCISLLERFTDDTALLQHSRFGVADRKQGYSADDVGRALVVCMKNFDAQTAYRINPLVNKYLSFLHYVQREDGLFHNFVSYERKFLDEVGSEDTFGRVLWGLGTIVGESQQKGQFYLAKQLFDRAMANSLPTFPRAVAYTICGLYGYLTKFPGASIYRRKMAQLADYLISLYNKHSNSQWKWFETIITYGNAKIPQSLFLAYRTLGEEKYLEVAVESLRFLTNQQYNGEYFDLIGNNGWLKIDREKASFAQQPIEIGYLSECYIEAYEITKEERYLKLAEHAAGWFLGRNRSGKAVFDFEEFIPLDGLEINGLNMNCGAEAVLSFILTNIAAEKAYQMKKGKMAENLWKR